MNEIRQNFIYPKIKDWRIGNKFRLNIPHTEESKDKISKKLKGRKPWNAGKELSKEHKQKVSTAMKNRIFSEEHIKNLSIAAIGKKRKPFSKEWIKNLKIARAKRVYTIEDRKKMSEAQKKVVAEGRSNLWRGGIYPEHKKIRCSFEMKIWRETVFKRDNYTCVLCNKGNKNGERTVLNADHIKPFSLFPELRFNINNGRTLCVDCHRKTDTYCIKTKTK